MAKNDFLPFSAGAGANTLDQADYEALSALTAGFTSGVAPSAACNKVWRQATIMASVLAQLIVDNTGEDAVDDGSTSTLLTNLKEAMRGRLINIQSFTAAGTATYSPSAMAKRIRVIVIGGGGGGGGCAAAGASQMTAGGGGASGSYVDSNLFTVPASSVPVVVGAGGAGGVGFNNGTSGGSSSFGSFISCVGGAPGGAGAVGVGNTQGGGITLPPTATVSTIISSSGSAGGSGLSLFSGSATASIGVSGAGGSSLYGSGAGSTNASGNGGSALIGANNAGGGGGGALARAGSSAANGGAGAPGAVYVFEYS